MGTIILIIILFIIVWPIIKVAVTVNRFKRNARKAYEQMFNQSAGAASSHPDPRKERKAGWTMSPTTKRKKIGRDVGEYVKFEEIETEFTETSRPANAGNKASSRTDFKAEQQIVDAEWTDIS